MMWEPKNSRLWCLIVQCEVDSGKNGKPEFHFHLCPREHSTRRAPRTCRDESLLPWEFYHERHLPSRAWAPPGVSDRTAFWAPTPACKVFHTWRTRDDPARSLGHAGTTVDCSCPGAAVLELCPFAGPPGELSTAGGPGSRARSLSHLPSDPPLDSPFAACPQEGLIVSFSPWLSQGFWHLEFGPQLGQLLKCSHLWDGA